MLLLQTERDGLYPSWPQHVSTGRIRAGKIRQRLAFETSMIRVLDGPRRRSHVRHLVAGKLLAKLTVPVERRLHRSTLGARLGIRPSLRLRQHLWALSDRAAYAGWSPQRLVSPVAVVSATDQPPLAVADPTLGWAGTTDGPLLTRTVEGFHWSFLHQPWVHDLGQEVSKVLEWADARLRSPAAAPHCPVVSQR